MRPKQLFNSANAPAYFAKVPLPFEEPIISPKGRGVTSLLTPILINNQPRFSKAQQTKRHTPVAGSLSHAPSVQRLSLPFSPTVTVLASFVELYLRARVFLGFEFQILGAFFRHFYFPSEG